MIGQSGFGMARVEVRETFGIATDVDLDSIYNFALRCYLNCWLQCN